MPTDRTQAFWGRYDETAAALLRAKRALCEGRDPAAARRVAAGRAAACSAVATAFRLGLNAGVPLPRRPTRPSDDPPA
jgi:hypothetical protein